MVSIPVIIHAIRSHPGEPNILDISELTMNIPEPIIEPITIKVESIKFKPLVNVIDSFVFNFKPFVVIKNNNYFD